MWGNYPKAWVQGEQWVFPFLQEKNKTKQKTHKHLFLYSPLPSQAAPVISNCVYTGEYVFLSFHISKYWKERGFGMKVCNRMNWESIMRNYFSPFFHLQTNADDFVSVWTKVCVPHVQSPSSFFRVFTRNISLAFSWSKKKKCYCTLYIYMQLLICQCLIKVRFLRLISIKLCVLPFLKFCLCNCFLR